MKLNISIAYIKKIGIIQYYQRNHLIMNQNWFNINSISSEKDLYLVAAMQPFGRSETSSFI